MQLTKLHGLGNDFVLIDAMSQSVDENELPALTQRLCDRRFGVGADGLMLVQPSEAADFRMRILNADGTEAEMCGNGIRCFAKYVYDHGLTHRTEISIDTLSGVRLAELQVEGKRVQSVRIDMGAPRFLRAEIPVIAGMPDPLPPLQPFQTEDRLFEVTCVNTGTPHAVIFLSEEVGEFPIKRYGPLIEHHAWFPQRTNVQFAQIVHSRAVRVRPWERSAGETMACGTGACAVVVAGVLTGQLERHTLARLPGGDLQIEWREDDRLFMTGAAEEVFTAQLTY
jgi:diaminopimelate epimerase